MNDNAVFSNCSFASFNKWILNADIILPKQKKPNPQTNRRKGGHEHIWNDEKNSDIAQLQVSLHRC